MLRLVTITLVTLITGSTSAQSVDGTPDRHSPTVSYSYFKQSRMLRLDTGHVMVRELAGWRHVQLQLHQQSEQEIRDFVAQLLRDDTVRFASPILLDKYGGQVIVTRDLLIGVDRSLTPMHAKVLVADSGIGNIIATDWAGMPNVFRLRSSARNGFDVLEQANALAALGEIEFAEPNMIFTGHGAEIPNDTYFHYCWGLHNKGQLGGTSDVDVDAPEAWDITKGDASIIIAVIDTGVQQDHPDINQIPGTDVTDDENSQGDGGPVNACDRHGTAIAGCITARINNELGVVGVAPASVTASIRTFISDEESCNGSWWSETAWTVEALHRAELMGARITNNSNSYGIESSAIAQKYADTRAAGMVHFAAAGNLATNEVAYPANLLSVNAIGAIGGHGQRVWFSNYGPDLAFSAPGYFIYTTDRTGTDGFGPRDYIMRNGTSYATCFASGVAALILAVDESLTTDEVESIMQAASTDLGAIGFDEEFGWGLINAHAAVIGAGPTTRIDDLALVTGELISGGIDDLRDSDDVYVHTRSGIGETATDLHHMEMIISAVTGIESPARIEVSIESFIDQSAGMAEIRLRNWRTGEFNRIGQYSIGLNEETITFEDIDTTDYVRTSGAIEFSIKHVVFVPFLAFRFDSFLDWVEIRVE